MKILIINGPNMDRLGEREPDIYGVIDWKSIEERIKLEFPTIDFVFYQSNSEEQIIDSFAFANNNFDGIVLNPGAFSHYSVAIRDAIELLKIPIIEVHLSNISSREDFRKSLITASKTNGYISGFQETSYLGAVYILTKIMKEVD